jgi:asparagine synthetase B (glutamine-hydrolysing)
VKTIGELGAELRALLCASVARKLKGIKRPALLLSGGVDSSLLACALAEAGVRPRVFSVAYGQYESEDVRRARLTAKYLFGTPLKVVHVARDFDSLARHARAAIRFAGNSREAMIEVSLLMWEALRAVRRAECDGVLVGCEAGAMFACDRYALKAKLEGPRAWRSMKLATLHNQECGWPLAANQVNRYYAEDRLNLRWLDPFLDEALIRWHMPLPYALLNYQRDKGLAHVAFPALLTIKPVRYSMQSKAGVPTAAEIFVREAGHASPAIFYNDIARELDINLHGDARHLARFVSREDRAFVSFIHALIGELNAAGLIALQLDCSA